MKIDKLIILSTIFFLFLSFVFLTIVESGKTDLTHSNKWMLYFADPKGNSLDFMIENYSQNPDFHWQISAKKEILKEGDLSVAKGEIKTVPVSIKEVRDKKITVTVSVNDNKKEIYKSF